MSTNWKFHDCKEKHLLLYSCLDWGLGHTTRSVPLIKEFLILGCDLIVACNSSQKALLEGEFPDLTFVELEGYDVSYGKTSLLTSLRILLQIRKILIRIKKEKAWLKSFLIENHVDGLISDNRYGFFHPEIPSIFITHQLEINSGYGRLADKISQKFLYKFINRFSACWVPDNSEKNVLAGRLSHPSVLPSIPVKYLGPVSRFSTCETTKEKKFEALVIISGPEPQRSVFEKMIIAQASASSKTIALVRGLPASVDNISLPNISVYNHLDAPRLNKLVCESEVIICRSGYTTIMDMVKLKKKMIVIPTPGQPEQEYLGEFLSEKNYVLKFDQSEFDLQTALQKAAGFTFTHIDTDMNEYKAVLKEFVASISS